eukprot:TRINITY_DN21037_c0_g1_i1.p1 TRINITY_DN21037_c0_g1~~TRINITY_DN21037_c0_g1_i1.p1  ORF type:complete len:227 (-),score=2.45 TRINITY_DN21037_c0_g1_i1:171-851(-)
MTLISSTTLLHHILPCALSPGHCCAMVCTLCARFANSFPAHPHLFSQLLSLVPQWSSRPMVLGITLGVRFTSLYIHHFNQLLMCSSVASVPEVRSITNVPSKVCQSWEFPPLNSPLWCVAPPPSTPPQSVAVSGPFTSYAHTLPLTFPLLIQLDDKPEAWERESQKYVMAVAPWDGVDRADTTLQNLPEAIENLKTNLLTNCQLWANFTKGQQKKDDDDCTDMRLN